MSNTMTKEALDLWRLNSSTLKEFMNKGTEPDKDFLSGYLYRGLNVGFLARLIGRRKFIKYFKDFPISSLLAFLGNNFMVKQNDPDEEYIKLFKDGSPIPEGYFLIEVAEDNREWNHYQDAIFLDYGKGNNKRYQPAKLLRDYLVQPFPGNKEILLGHAYFAIFGFKVPFTFFILERISD